MPDNFKEVVEQAMQPQAPMGAPGEVEATTGDIGAQGELPAQQFAQSINKGRL